jgi:predicted DNA-binding ribbon-helix-helix protein
MPGASDDQSTAGYLKSSVAKRSLVVGGHRTSVSLEDVFWNELRAIAKERDVHLSKLVATIDATREHANLSSAIRLFVFEHRTRSANCAQQRANAPRSAKAAGRFASE